MVYKDNQDAAEAKQKDPFFDNMRSDNKGYRENFGKRGDFRGGYRGGHHYDGERGRGGHHNERGRGGYRGRPQTGI